MNTEQFEKQIIDYLDDECGLDITQIGRDDDIFGPGLLDSLESVKILAFLRERFELNIQPYDLELDDIRTIAGIARLVAAKKEGQSRSTS